MALAIQATLSALFDIVATVGDPGVGANALANITYNGFDVSQLKLNGGSSPVVTKMAIENIVLGSGTATIDLTALLGVNGAAVNATGSKMYGYLLQAPSGNGALITVTVGGSNGYNFEGSGGQVQLQPGETRMAIKTRNSAAVGSGAKIMTLTGTGSTDNLNVIFLFGP